MGSKKEIKKVDSSKYLGYIVVTCISLFIASFIYKFTTTETIDSNLRWCPNHNTYHNINDGTEDEIWCNNCKTWHAPNEESSSPSIK